MKGVILTILLILLWALGLLAFADKTHKMTPAAEPPRADAIVALTGASDERLKAAIHLLRKGKGQRLLITGVDEKVTRSDLRAVLGGPKHLYVCCVDLGFKAKTTIGNAAETAVWAKDRQISSLIVVTADYHMPRSLIELKSRMPNVRLYPYAIATPVTDTRHWQREGFDAPRLALEYTKYLIVRGRELVLGMGSKARAPQEATG